MAYSITLRTPDGDVAAYDANPENLDLVDKYIDAHNKQDLDLIRIRSADGATFVAFGAADIGIAGQDDLLELDYPELYVPLDLNIALFALAAPPIFLELNIAN